MTLMSCGRTGLEAGKGNDFNELQSFYMGVASWRQNPHDWGREDRSPSSPTFYQALKNGGRQFSK
jgi:hypothetical protein